MNVRILRVLSVLLVGFVLTQIATAEVGGTWRWLQRQIVDQTLQAEPENGWIVRTKNPGVIAFTNEQLEGLVVLEVRSRQVPFASMTVKCFADAAPVAEWTTERQSGLTTQTTPPFEVKKGQLIRIEFHSSEHPVGVASVWLRLASENERDPSSAFGKMENIVQNGGFEHGFDSWGQENWSNTKGVDYALAAGEGRQGGTCVRISSSLPGRHALSQRIRNVQGGREYEVSFWVRGSDYEFTADGTPAMVACDFVPVQVIPRPVVAIRPSGTFSWKQVRFTVQAPSGTQELLLNLIHTRGTLMFDDISVVARPASPSLIATGASDEFPSGVPRLAPDGKTVDALRVETGRFGATIERIGGKVSSLTAEGVEWCVMPPVGIRGWAEGICKDWFAEDVDKELLTAPYTLTVVTNHDALVVSAIAEPAGMLKGVRVHRTFTFRRGATFIDVRHECSSEGPARILTPRIHHFLNIWRTPSDPSSFRLYVGGRDGAGPIEAVMNQNMSETFEAPRKEHPWIGVMNAEAKGLCFESDDQGPGIWMCWSGNERNKGTLEQMFQPITVGTGTPWICSYRVHLLQGLPTLGIVSTDVVASVAMPDLTVLVERPFGPSRVEITPLGGETKTLSVDFDKERLLHVALPAIAAPGPVRVTITPEASPSVTLSAVPRTVERYGGPSQETADAAPMRFRPLTAQPPPEPGEGGFRYYYSDYYQGEAYVSPDAPTMLAFGQTSRIPDTGSVIRLVLETPAGVEVLGGRFVQGVETNVIDGGKTWQHRIDVRYGKASSRGGVTELIVRTSLSAGSNTVFTYATERDGKTFFKTQLPVHVIALPEVPRPTRLFTAFVPLNGTLNGFPDMKSFARVGFSHPNQAYFEQVVETGAKNAVQKFAAEQGFKDLQIDYMRFLTGRDPDGFCEDREGHRKAGQTCPTYRGADFERVIDVGKRAIDLGIFTHAFDPERTDGADICYCPRCVNAFQAYWAKSQPQAPFEDPHVFMKNPAANLDSRRAWILFKAEAYAESFRAYREAIVQHMEGKDLDPSSFRMLLYAQPGWQVKGVRPGKDDWLMGVVESSLQDLRLFNGVFDVLAPMIYIEVNGRFRMQADMEEIAAEIEGMRAFTDGRIPVSVTLSAGYPYTPFLCNIEPDGMMRDQVLEAFAAGASGVIIYSEGWFDALDMRYFAEAMRSVMKAEDVFADGIPLPAGEFVDVTSQTFVKGVRRDETVVVLVSEYSSRMIVARIKFRADRPLTVTNLSTGQIVKRCDPGENEFEVVLAEERAVLFKVAP